jgi:hypothetical protein
MSQLSLFDSRPAEQPAREPDLAYIRKHLNRLLRLARKAERMPWGPAQTRSWENFFPELAALLPEDEGQALAKEFAAQLQRLKQADS